MHILVCVKHVPDIQANRTFAETGRINRGASDDTLNELDENAIEAALTLVDEHGGSVTALTVGPRQAKSAVRRAVQLGAARAVHVTSDDIAGSDALVTARILAHAVAHVDRDTPVDLVLTGMAGLDGLTSMVPAAISAFLDLPQLTLAAKVEVSDGEVTIERHLDDAIEVLAAPLPALVSVIDIANTPRSPSMAGIMAARSTPVETIDLIEIGLTPDEVGVAGSGSKVLEAWPKPPRDDQLVFRSDAAVTDLVNALLERRLL